MARLKAEVASRRRGKLKGLSVLVALALVLSLGIVAVPMAGVVEAQATLQVNATTGTVHTGDPCPVPRNSAIYADIQAAINCSVAGDTINVAAGTYNEGLIIIDKDLSIVGDPLDKPVITPTEDTGTILNAKGWFRISDATVNFENLVFDGTGQKIWAAILYQEEDSTGGTVENCDISNIRYKLYAGRGIAIYGTYVEVLGCTFTNIERVGILTYGVGNTTTALIKGCTYTGKGAGDWLDYAFEVSAGASAIIEDNTVTDCYGEDSGWSSAGIYVHGKFSPGTSANITGNTISGSNYGIVVGYAYVVDTSVVVAHYNNIAGNDYGLNSTGPQVDATNNWWGAQNGPGDVGPGSGDAVSDNVDYDPWLGAELTEICCETICGCGTMHDTPTGGDVTIDATGNHTVAVCTYANMPCGTCPFTNKGSYYDVHLEDATNVTSLTVQFCPANQNEVIRYWDGSSWVACSDQVYSDGCIVVTITDETQPSLSDLTGLPFGQGFRVPVGGEAYPVNKISVLAPWIAVAVLLAGGISWFTLRRRRAQSQT